MLQARKPNCISGSPPENVTPPPECSMKTLSRSAFSTTSSGVILHAYLLLTT
ncbi:MAG: hypothetical protein MZV63_27865 [Marinilabiliales bacterium]|nr:hypothetical protein [Marinilabiliales bacterium]